MRRILSLDLLYINLLPIRKTLFLGIFYVKNQVSKTFGKIPNKVYAGKLAFSGIISTQSL